MKMPPSIHTREQQPAHKATLFCPDCGHESRINGDWLIQVHTASTSYECPACGTIIDTRRHQQELTDGSDGSLQFAGES